MGLGCGDHRDVVVDKGPGKPRRRTVGAVSRSGVWRGRRSTLTGHPHRCRGVATGCIGSRGRTHQVLDEIGQHLRGIESGRAGGDGGGAGGVAVADRCPAGDGSPDTALERHPATTRGDLHRLRCVQQPPQPSGHGGVARRGGRAARSGGGASAGRVRASTTLRALRVLGKHLLEMVAPDEADALLERRLEREETAGARPRRCGCGRTGTGRYTAGSGSRLARRDAQVEDRDLANPAGRTDPIPRGHPPAHGKARVRADLSPAPHPGSSGPPLPATHIDRTLTRPGRTTEA